jgi:hypothetical protein
VCDNDGGYLVFVRDFFDEFVNGNCCKRVKARFGSSQKRYLGSSDCPAIPTRFFIPPEISEGILYEIRQDRRVRDRNTIFSFALLIVVSISSGKVDILSNRLGIK